MNSPGCVPLGWYGSMIQDHSDHGASNEPVNPLWSRIHRFLWCTMIQVILDHWSLSKSWGGIPFEKVGDPPCCSDCCSTLNGPHESRIFDFRFLFLILFPFPPTAETYDQIEVVRSFIPCHLIILCERSAPTENWRIFPPVPDFRIWHKQTG